MDIRSRPVASKLNVAANFKSQVWYMYRASCTVYLSRPTNRQHTFINNILYNLGTPTWIELAKNRDRWRALVNVVMNLLVTKTAGNVLTS